MPATNAATAITTTGAGGASRSSGGTIAKIPSVATRRMRAGRQWSVTTPPVMRPADWHVRITAHAVAPPSSLLATTGPSTLNAPTLHAFTNANWTTMDQSH